MGKSSPPATPDYVGAANATSTGNINNSLIASSLSNPNISNPYGSVNYTNAGTTAFQKAYADWQDSGGYGQPPNAAQYITPGSQQQTVSLSPQQQQLFDSQQATQLGLSNFQKSLLPQIQDSVLRGASGLPGAFDGAEGINHNVVDSLYKQQSQYLDPQYAQGQEQLDSRLRAQGLAPGSQAYDTAMNNFQLQKQQAYSNAMDNATAQGTQAGLAATQENSQAYQQGLTSRQLPMQELAQLMNFTSPTIPQGNSTASGAVPGADLLGATQSQFSSNLAGVNASNAAAGQTTSEVGGMAAMAAMLYMMSDRRLKKQIERVGTTLAGIPIYTFLYINEPDHMPVHMGVMAQDLLETQPEAVVKVGGYYAVNYSLVK